MKTLRRYREVIPDARRVVIKIGSRVLCQKSGKPDMRSMRRLTQDIARIQKAGHEVVVVSSGAVGSGMEALGMTSRPEQLPEQQMAAAVGQCRLISRYADLFGTLGCRIGQVLLTHENFRHKVQLTNARRTLEHLIRHEVIPIINENDVVTDEEIRADLALGDNDNLASLVSELIRADLLIILTTVDGLRQRDAAGRSRRVRVIETIGRKAYAMVTASTSALSKGGMYTKLKAAERATKAGCTVVIADGRKADILPSIMEGHDVGTLILASGT